MASRMRGVLLGRALGAALLLVGCGAPDSNALTGAGSGSGSALKLGKGKAVASTDPSCAPSDTGTGPKAICPGADVAPAAPDDDLFTTPDPAPAPAAPAPIKAALALTRHPDGAAITNCLKVQVNGGPLVDLGCNKGALVPSVQVDALPKPACNVVRLILFSDGVFNRTTESAENIALDFRIQQTGDNAFAVECNDNRDNDFADLNLDISSADANLTIENTGLGCQP